MARTDNTPADGPSELVGQFVRIFQRGQTWHANYQHEGSQRRRSLKTRSKKEARRLAVLLEAELLQGRHRPGVDPPAIAEAVHEYLEYIAAEDRSAKTLVKYRFVLGRLKELAARAGAARLDEVGPALLDRYRRERIAAGAAAKTIYTELTIVRQLTKFAVSRGRLASDPLAGMKLRKPKPMPQPCWTLAEVVRILEASREPQRAAYTLLAETGMRIGELQHLTWSDVDFEHGLIHVRPKAGWKPKSGDARAVPMSPRARAVLEGLPRRWRWVLTAATRPGGPAGPAQISERRLLRLLKKLLGRLGLAGHLHTFRHAFISRALTSGVPEAIVRQWVGHVDPDVIRMYTHVADAISREAMQRLNAATSQTASGLHEGPGADSAQIQHTTHKEAGDRVAK